MQPDIDDAESPDGRRDGPLEVDAEGRRGDLAVPEANQRSIAAGIGKGEGLRGVLACFGLVREPRSFPNEEPVVQLQAGMGKPAVPVHFRHQPLKYVEQGEDPPASRRMVRVACEDSVTVTAYVQAVEARTSLGEQFGGCRSQIDIKKSS